jgi:arylsulfatase A-like enzyme
LFEGGIRVPMIAYWPGKIKPATVSNHISASWDLLPTICQATGTPAPSGIDGISLWPELTGKKQMDHSYLYWEYFTYNYNWNKPENNTPRNYLESIALRMGKWKAIKKDMYNDKNAPIALYNLETDPGEKNNVANENPEIIKKITDILPDCSIDNAPYFPYKKQKN